MKRLAAAVLLCAGLAACKQNDLPAAQNVQGVGDVKVLEARIVPSGDASLRMASGTLNYLIVRIELTNDFGFDGVPQIDHIYLTDRDGNRYQAKDSGSSVFTGISNSQQTLKQHDKREYIVGFRTTDPNVAGTISYER